MRILITGIGGQDGRLLSEIFHRHGFEIVGTTRSVDQARIRQIRELLPGSVKVISLNLNNFSDLDKLFSSQKFDVVFHFAAQSSVGKSFAEPLINILSPTEISFNLLEVARLHQRETKIIFAGSTEVFGSHGALAINENSHKQPMSPYAVGKLSQEAVTAFFRNSYGMWVSNAYLSNHESLYRGQQFVTMKIVKGAFDILNGKSSALKLGNLSVIRDWGWAPEFMAALVLLSKKQKPEDLIVATGKSISLFDFATEVFNFFGVPFENHVEFDSTLLRAGDPSEVHYDTSNAQCVLNWSAATRGTDVPRKLAQSFQEGKSSNA